MARNTRNSYGIGGNAIPRMATLPILSQRNPAATDTNFEIGTDWINQTSNRKWTLTSVSAGSASWVELTSGGVLPEIETITGDGGGAVGPDAAGNVNLTGAGGGMIVSGVPGSNLLTPRNLRNTTSYVVDSTAGETEYTSIQVALDAANAAGGGLVHVKAGTYVENLTFYDNIDIQGDSEQSTTITGVHTPPAAGSLNLFRLNFTNATDIFNSAVAGTTTIIMEDCTMAPTNGYTFNLLNWTGSLTFYDCRNTAGTNDGIVNNTGGSPILIFSGTYGNGVGNSMIISDNVSVFAASIACPIDCQTGAVLSMDNSSMSQTLTFSNNSAGNLANVHFFTGATASINHVSSGTVTFTEGTVESTNSPAITGTGVFVMGAVTFTFNALTAGTLTITNAARLTTGGYKVIEDANPTSGIATLVAGTVTVNTTSVTANSRIQLTHQNNAGTAAFASTTARTPATSFVITSGNAADTSDVAWFIIEPQ